MFWVISVYFNVRNILPKSGTFSPGHPVYFYFLAELLYMNGKNSFSFKVFEGIHSSVGPQFMQYRLRTERRVNTRGKCFVSPVVNILFRKALKISWVCFLLHQIIGLPFSHLFTEEIMFSCRTKQGTERQVLLHVNTQYLSRSLTSLCSIRASRITCILKINILRIFTISYGKMWKLF